MAKNGWKVKVKIKSKDAISFSKIAEMGVKEEEEEGGGGGGENCRGSAILSLVLFEKKK